MKLRTEIICRTVAWRLTEWVSRVTSNYTASFYSILQQPVLVVEANVRTDAGVQTDT